MKRTIAQWLGLPAAAGLLVFALLPAHAQAPTEATAPMGLIHGSVMGGHNHLPAGSGAVTLSPRGGKKGDYKFKISKKGEYSGEVPAGNYELVVMMQDQTGYAEYSTSSLLITIPAGEDLEQDLNMGNLVAARASTATPIAAAAPAAAAPAPAAVVESAPIKGNPGSIHGRVIGPTGDVTPAGTVSLSLDGGPTAKYSFPVDSDGNYSGKAAPGKYTLVFRAPNTPANKVVDEYDGIRITAGEDVDQDIDMSRKAFLDKLTPDQRKQLEAIKLQNQAAMKDNAVIKDINGDIKAAVQDFQDANTAPDPAVKIAKFSDAERLMLRDTAARPDASTLWVQLGQAQSGLGAAKNDPQEYDKAIINLKKALALEADAKKPSAGIESSANAALGEVYARTGKVAEANVAFDAAAKADPTRAELFLRNEAVIFSQVGNTDAQAAAADEAIKADPKQPIPYYLKAQGLVVKATVDPKTHAYVAPPGCIEAYQMYLQLAPNGPYAPDVKAILASFNQKPAGRK